MQNHTARGAILQWRGVCAGERGGLKILGVLGRDAIMRRCVWLVAQSVTNSHPGSASASACMSPTRSAVLPSASAWTAAHATRG